MSEHTQSGDFSETDNPARDLSRGACCIGELIITADIKLTYAPHIKKVLYRAETHRETATRCVAYTCGDITAGELSPYGPYTYNVCESVARDQNEPYNNGGKKLTVYPNGRTFDPMGVVRPSDPGPLDDEGHLRFRHCVSLGCCDYGCAPRFWGGNGDGNDVIQGSVPGSLVKIRRRIGWDWPPGQPPQFIIEEGEGFSKDTWDAVVNDILSFLGPGGKYPYKFKPCCKKGGSGDSGGGKG